MAECGITAQQGNATFFMADSAELAADIKELITPTPVSLTNQPCPSLPKVPESNMDVPRPHPGSRAGHPAAAGILGHGSEAFRLGVLPQPRGHRIRTFNKTTNFRGKQLLYTVPNAAPGLTY
jgi:hypothetical protein